LNVQRSFILSFEDAEELGISFQKYTRVRRLRAGTWITSIAGDWRENGILQYMFVTADGDLACIPVFERNDFFINGIDVKVTDIQVGQQFCYN
jgi:hypothetical protein|tara:strand:- start:8955 stop:9233 length:279 start_codon:yes stop_codon:yes gene_type:complete